jgi:pimeloyl-ACP methyl ester carboxylesterase
MDLKDITVQGNKAGFRTGRSGVDPKRNNLILVHGSGGGSMSWLLQTNGLDDDMNVIAVDLPGHGETPGGPVDRVEDYAAWLIEFIEAAGLAPCFIGGHSLGGAIVLRLALDRPDLLKGILLIGAGAKLRVMPSILHTVLNDFYDALPVLVNYCYTKEAPKDLVGQGVEIMKQAGPQVLHDDFAACDKFDVIEDLEKITLPTLIIVGKDDILTPVKYSEFLSQKIKDSRLTILDKGGHCAMHEYPNEFNAAIREFIKEIG